MTRATVVRQQRRRAAAAPRGRRPSRPKKRSRSLNPFVVGLVAVALLGAAAALISLAGRESSDRDAPVWAAARITGTALPVFRPGGADPAVGVKAPQVHGTGIDGRDLALAPTGRIQVIVFLAHWCPHCREDVPAVVEWLEKNGMPAGVDIYAVSTWADPKRPNFPPARWLREERWTVPTLVDDESSSVSKAFGIHGTPYWVFLDGTGTVVRRVEAELGGEGLDRILSALRG